ncbi:cytochrome d ubiquinol oxidase subunit II [Natronoglycomyces albus]|uniref:Cytochrome d ubiquinol oxidase subunit II n=1 Tax=Natronoglycomyces albus TaxID=2811108 RepID=A0A895XSN1_9ACTN|nr:cytochrome d ubiquinol oxidase subunit II [Natronoglycomyces albus]QSB06672.1 cytochrome d ubiquinol oxidase subunit II [Natronoglycomyces albus]
MDLATLWFILIVVLWLGYLFLEGFDLGVGMLLGRLPRNETERRVMINTVGPVWDGNEVWLVTAIGAMFAAFPHWYASLLSALYLPILLVVLALILRACAFEWRGKHDSDRWRTWWTACLTWGSAIIAFGVGQALAATTLGIPLDDNGNRLGGVLAGFHPLTWIGGVAAVGFALVHGALYVALKTEGDLRYRARKLSYLLIPAGLAPLATWAYLVVARAQAWPLLIGVAATVVAGAVAWWRSSVGREGQAFAAWGLALVTAIATIFTAAYPVVLPSSISSDADLTVTSAAVSDYTLTVMTWAAAFGLPVVLTYQGWTYWVFRRRLSTGHMPQVHPVRPLPAQPPDAPESEESQVRS